MTQTDDARGPKRIFLFDYDVQDETGDWKTQRGWSETPPYPMLSTEYIRVDLATQPDPVADPRVMALVEALRGLVPILCEGVDDGCGKLSRHDCAACEGYTALAAFNTGTTGATGWSKRR